jgi:hypothetical protein
MRHHHAAWALALALVPSIALGHDDINFTVNIDHDKPSLTCSDIEMRFWEDHKHAGDIITVRRDQSVSLAAGGSTTLRVRASDRGGVRVQAASGNTASAFICMAAGATSEAKANALLDGVQIHNEAGELTVTGPDDAQWAAYIVVSVPRGMKLDLRAENGELALQGVSGAFTMRTTNGPITVSDVAGEVDGETVNGPICFRGHSGDIRLAAQNGPVDVKLDEPTWNGKGLNARTSNGPVQFTAPEGLRTGVQVEGSAHSPFIWNGVTQHSYDEWTRSHSVWLGDGPVTVKLSTVNGPVQIKAPKGASKGRPKSSSKDVGI